MIEPKFCSYHQHWTNGSCAAGKRSLNRNDLTVRICDIDAMLADPETVQSNGFAHNAELRAEQVSLEYLRDAVFGGGRPVDRP